MVNYATTIAIFSCQDEARNKVSMKIGNQNLIEKIAATLYDAMSGFIITIVVALFTLLIKFKGLESLSDFCYPNKF